VAALECALGLTVAWVEDDPAERELAAEGEEVFRRAALGRDRALAVPDELLGQRAEALEAARHPEGDVCELLREDERAGEGARVGQAAGDDVAAPGLAIADRDLRARLAEVELRELAGAVARALEAAWRRQEARPQLAQQLVEDRLPAVVAELLELLADAHARQCRLVVEQFLDRLEERIELRGARRPGAVARRRR
jgi:hypothetical protein